MAELFTLSVFLVFVASACAIGNDVPSVNLSYSIYKASIIKVTSHFDFLGVAGD